MSAKVKSSTTFLDSLEAANTKVLEAVRKKIQDRASWSSKLSPNMNTKQDILILKQLSETQKLQSAWDTWQSKRQALLETYPLFEDPDQDMREMALLDANVLEDKLSHVITHTIPKLIVPSSPTKEYGALIEMKSGAGGSESSLFLEELMRMYLRVCNNAHEIPVGEGDEDDEQAYRWSTEVVEESRLDIGGIKNAIFEVRGKGAYDVLRFESGVHRVQRVPATETQGRVHTSTVAVLVFPLVEEEADKPQDELFKMEDVKIEVMRSRGAGGQHVNKTESAVRLTHIPTGITVAMQDERSQHQNKRRAFTVLRSRLLDLKMQKEQAEAKAVRQGLVKSYDRSEKIRTYNWAQDRVTDHRIGLSLRNLDQVMEGEGLIDFLLGLRKQWDNEKIAEILAP